MDKNDDGLVEFDEYRVWMEHNQPNKMDSEELEDIFMNFDVDEDGFVSLEELFG